MTPLLRYWKPALIVVGLLVVTVMAWRDRKAREELGRWKAIGQRLQQDSARAAATVRRTDSVFSVDTVRLTRAVTRFERVRDSVLVRLTDTLTVERFVSVADSVVRACRSVVDSCTASLAARDSLLAIVGQQRAADRRLFEARLRVASPRLLPFVEAGVDPINQLSFTGRAGLEIRVLGPLRLTTALEITAVGDPTSRAFLGARWTF